MRWHTGKEGWEVPPVSDPLDFHLCSLFFSKTPGHQIGFPLFHWGNSAATKGNRLSSNGI